MVNLTIDGKSVQAKAGSTILEAAAGAGIGIPTLCWLQKVSPTGACRICAVEIEGVERTMTACNTPVQAGISVVTQSPALEEMRRKVMQLMLVNHPLDCPVCDAAGECDLQDRCYELKAIDQSYTAQSKRREIRYDWTLIESDPNRCIACEKCVKVGHEVVGCGALKLSERGEQLQVDTVDGAPLSCEFCGNCLAVCPTGSLISKPFKFRGRPWTFTKTRSVCAFCSCGCPVDYHVAKGEVARVTSPEDGVNSGNLCINGTFGYSYLHSPARLTTPLVRHNGGSPVPTDWESALAEATRRLQSIIAGHGGGAVAGIGSTRVTNEEQYLFQKFLRVAVGTNHIDSEARLGYAQAQAALEARLGVVGASAPLTRLDDAEAIVVIGSDLNAEAHGLEYRVLRAAMKKDAKLVLLNMRDVKLKRHANLHLKYLPGQELPLLAGLVKETAKRCGAAAVPPELAALSSAACAQAAGVSAEALAEGAALLAGKRVAIIFGSDVLRAAAAPEVVNAVIDLATVTGAAAEGGGGIFPVDQKNNSLGALRMGLLPDRLPGGASIKQGSAAVSQRWGRDLPTGEGRDLWGIIQGIEEGSIKALYLMGCDLAGFPDNARIRKALASLELLIVQDIFPGETLPCAHVVLPAAAAAEKNGSFTTLDNRVQPVRKALSPPATARTDAEIIAELYLRLTGSPVDASAEAVRAELEPLLQCAASLAAAAPRPFAAFAGMSLDLAAECRLLVGGIGHHNGTLSTHSENNVKVSPKGYLELHPADAEALKVGEGDAVTVRSVSGSLTAPARINPGLQPGLLFAPVHFRELNANALLRGNSNLVRVTVQRG